MVMRSRSSRGSSRRQRFWSNFGTGVFTLVGGGRASSNLTANLMTAFPEMKDYTLLRIRGTFQMNAQVFATTTIDVGIIVVTRQAFEAGTTSVPDPELDDADWLWYSTLTHRGQRTERSAGVFAESPHALEIDNRAMRRIQGNEQRVIMSVKNRSGSNVDIDIEGRILFLLH